ncbi:MAG TPA: hypothetical protein VF077_13480, partial [Nitrospiraceae bacterium]
MAEVTSLVVVKEFTYRDDTAEEWSNRYFLTGTPPQSSNGWKTLADGFIDVERACYAPSSKVVRAYGYDDNALDAHSVWGWDYDGAGTSLPGLLVSGAGEHPYAG